MAQEIKVTGIKKAMAKHMSMSWATSPLEGFTVSVDMTAALAFKDQIKGKGVPVTMNHIIIKAVQIALSEYPHMNASFDSEREIMTLHDSINMGIAIDAGEGLIVGNIKDVQNLDYAGIAEASAALIHNAKTKKLTLDDITGGTFTITNLGMMGIEACFPIINQPELGILGVNKIMKLPVVIDDEIVIRPIMKLNLNADHRVIDGAYASGFITKIKECLENPKR